MKTRACLASSSPSSHMVAPDPEGPGESGGDHGGGEGLEDDRSVVSDVVQRTEQAVEVHASGAQVATVALTDMDVSQQGAGLDDGPEHVRLLDVHVVAVQMDADVRARDGCDEVACLASGVEHVGLVAVGHLQADPDPGLRRALGHAPEHLLTVGHTTGGGDRVVHAHRAVDDPAQVLRAELGQHVHGPVEQVLSGTHGVRVLAADVAGPAESQTPRGDDPVVIDGRTRRCCVEAGRVHQRELDEVEPCLAGPADRIPEMS